MVLQVVAEGESAWALVAYQTFESGALPSLLLLRRHATSEEPLRGCPSSTGDSAPSLVAEGTLLETVEIGGLAGWCAFAEFAEQCDPALRWTARFWTVASPSGFDRQAVAVTPLSDASEMECWWQGRPDVARVADAKLPPSDSEEERSPTADQASDEGAPSPAECLMSPEEPEEVVEVEPQEEAMAAAAKARQRRGEWFDCLASRRAGRYALRFHLIFKAGGAKQRPQFQITCEHHEPDVLLNKNGKSYKLACRRTAAIGVDTPEAERDVIRYLLKWVRAGPCTESRLAHQGMEDADFCDSSSDSGNEDAAGAGSAGAGAAGAGAAGEPDAPKGETAGDGAPSPVADGVHPKRCWLCDGERLEADCEWYRILFADVAPIAQTATSLRPVGRVAAPGNTVQLGRDLVQTADVPGDGACLFHSLGREIASAFRGHPLLADGAQQWRDMLAAYVLSTTDSVGGTSVQDWVTLVSGMAVADYVAHLSRPATWGGFLEIALIAQMWSGATGAALTVVVLLDAPAGFQTLSFVGSALPDSKLVLVAWQGAHWVRARLRPEGAASVRRWAAAS